MITGRSCWFRPEPEPGGIDHNQSNNSGPQFLLSDLSHHEVINWSADKRYCPQILEIDSEVFSSCYGRCSFHTYIESVLKNIYIYSLCPLSRKVADIQYLEFQLHAARQTLLAI
jgi:hypothetical protein